MSKPPIFVYQALAEDMCEDMAEGLAEITLDAAESAHAAGARRLREGNIISVFNGQGGHASGEISAIGHRKREVSVRLHDFIQDQPPSLTITLASALPKGDRLSTMIDMVTQLGVSRFIPLDTEFSISKANDKLLNRCRRVMIEACKQSRRTWFPEVEAPRSLKQLLQDPTQGKSIMADATGKSLSMHSLLENHTAIIVIIGPEGGFSANELQLAVDKNIEMVCLSDGVLRIETAAVAIISALL